MEAKRCCVNGPGIFQAYFYDAAVADFNVNGLPDLAFGGEKHFHYFQFGEVTTMSRTLAILLILCSLPLAAEAREWKLIGPHAGNIGKIVADRRNPKLFYLATGDPQYFSRLYRSEDGGDSWHRLPLSHLTDFAVHPETSALYAIDFTREYNNSVVYSNDQGHSFRVRAINVPELRRIFLDPFNENRIFGLASTPVVSNDGGRTWTDVAGFPYKEGDKLPRSLGGCRATGDSFTDLIVSPASESQIFLSGFIHSACGGVENTSPITLESTNSARTWRVIDNRNYVFQWDPVFPDRAFATTVSFVDQSQSIKKLEAGSWITISTAHIDSIFPLPSNIDSLFGLRRKYYAGPAELFFSKDAGRTWNAVNSALDNNFFTLATSQDGTLIAGTSGAGVFRKRPGEDWREASAGLHESLFIQIAQNKSGSQAYSLIEGRYAFRSSNASSDWEALLSSLVLIGRHFQGRIFCDPKEARTVMIDLDYGPFLISQDFGDTWQSLGHFSYPAFDPRNPRVVYLTGSGRVWKSVDGGLNPQPLPLKFEKPHIKTVVDPFDSATLYFLSNKIFKSTDGGRTMKILTSQFRYANIMVALPQPNTFLLPYGGIYKTTDGGLSWILLSATDAYIQKLAVVSSSHLFALASGDLLESIDGGRTWTNINAEFGRDFTGTRPHQRVTDIGDARGRYFYVATTKGVFLTANK